MARNKNLWLVIEFALLFFGVPIFLFFEKSIIHPTSILFPVLVALILYFRTQKDFKAQDLIQMKIPRKIWFHQIIIVILSGVFLLIYVMIFEHENLFNLPKGNPVIWLAMLGFYPVFSAYGQEVVFRKFLFMRYKKLFPKNWMIILVSGITFSFVHIVFFSALSLILTFFAGLYLAFVYQKTRSVLFVAILHGIMGFLIFTVGLGQHFWIDMLEWL